MATHVLVANAFAVAATGVDMTPVSDTWIGIQNGHFFPQSALKLFGGWFSGQNLTSVTLVTPRSRMVVPPRLYPIDMASNPPDRPHIWDRRTNPFTLNPVEEISLLANIGGTLLTPTTAVMIVGETIDPIPPGDVFTLHGVSTTPAISGEWTQINVSWDQTIPSGTYTVIGSWHQSTNAVCHRWNFRQRTNRPGFLSLTSLGNITDPSYYFGGWGALGQFNTTAYPFLEVYCYGTDATHDVGMNMIKTG